MNAILQRKDDGVPIGAVERDTGLTKDTLRIWERRYGFPQPVRDANGERVYPREQVEKLRLLKRLLDQGYRPGRIIQASCDELQSIAAGLAEPPDTDQLTPYLDLLKKSRATALREALGQALARQGLDRFVRATLGPLNFAVGEAWMRDELGIAQEHLYTEQVQVLLRSSIAQMPNAERAPRVLLTSLPGEPHSLGLLMVQALLALEQAATVALGTETPANEILRAGEAHDVDVVALSYSAAYPGRQALASLKELRAALPARVALWGGGAAVARVRLELEGLVLFRSLDQIAAAVRDWRSAHPESRP